ncbi:MAG: efflux RND transporter periplasmic adaptor subunit [Clostridia bacterium]|nr:efflux RND transporter periplasmic adaptor subunit [Clostridia bacterium]
MKTKLITFAALLLALTLSCALAFAVTANATVVAPETTKITAAMSGILLPFDFVAGDRVAAGDTLFTYDTIPVYAQSSGKVVAIFAEEGASGAGVMERYGALAVIEPKNALYIAASTAQAYNKEENRFLHVGQTLYLKCGSEEGEGRITNIDGANYIVEILDGDFELRDNVRCFRKSDMKAEEETGRGTVARYADTAVQAHGRITAIHVKEGDTVADGDLLFEVVDASSKPFEPLSLTAPANGVLSALYAVGGMQVYRGQLLCEIANLDALELSVEVDEMDLDGLRVGDTLTYTLDAYAGQTFTGTVKEIRPLGMQRQNASYFDVRLSIHSERNILPGMNGTVTLGK